MCERHAHRGTLHAELRPVRWRERCTHRVHEPHEPAGVNIQCWPERTMPSRSGMVNGPPCAARHARIQGQSPNSSSSRCARSNRQLTSTSMSHAFSSPTSAWGCRVEVAGAVAEQMEGPRVQAGPRARAELHWPRWRHRSAAAPDERRLGERIGEIVHRCGTGKYRAPSDRRDRGHAVGMGGEVCASRSAIIGYSVGSGTPGDESSMPWCSASCTLPRGGSAAGTSP